MLTPGAERDAEARLRTRFGSGASAAARSRKQRRVRRYHPDERRAARRRQAGSSAEAFRGSPSFDRDEAGGTPVVASVLIYTRSRISRTA